MNSHRSELLIFAGLLAAGIALYALRWVLFPEPALHNEMERFLIGDVAFLFLQVALVTMLVDRMLRIREKQAVLQKLNMVIGAFFSEVGTELLGMLAQTDTALSEVRDDLVPTGTWGAEDYAHARAALAAHHAVIDITACDLAALRELLRREKSFLLGLLGNQALLEHESFTELLWAVTHLAEELNARESFQNLSEADAAHLDGDARRAYIQLVDMWLSYVRHLQTQYPYLFSLAVRTNPLDPAADAVVRA